MLHELKILPEFFDAVASGKKTAEIRRNDRRYAAGDEIAFREFSQDAGYTGRSCGPFSVTHVCGYGQPDGQVVLSISKSAAAPGSEDGFEALGRIAALARNLSERDARRPKPELRTPSLVMEVDLPRFGISKGDSFEFHSENDESFFAFAEAEDGPVLVTLPKTATFVTGRVVSRNNTQ